MKTKYAKNLEVDLIKFEYGMSDIEDSTFFLWMTKTLESILQLSKKIAEAPVFYLLTGASQVPIQFSTVPKIDPREMVEVEIPEYFNSTMVSLSAFLNANLETLGRRLSDVFAYLYNILGEGRLSVKTDLGLVPIRVEPFEHI